MVDVKQWPARSANYTMAKINTLIERHPAWILFIFFFSINFLLSLKMKYPITSDEYNTMAEALYILGNKNIGEVFQSLYTYGYYGWGYSIIYAWVYNIFHNINMVFHTALITNSILVSIIPSISYHIGVKYFNISKIKSFFIAIIVALYPSYFIYSKYANNEIMLEFIVWPIIYLLFEYKQKNNIFYTFLIGLFSSYAYTVHGRGLAVLLVAFLCFVLILLTSKEKWYLKILHIFLYLLGIILFISVNHTVKNYIIFGFSGLDTSNVLNTMENFISSELLTTFFNPHIYRILYGFCGQLFYFAISTFGMVTISIFAFLSIIVRSIKDRIFDEWSLLSIYTVGLMAITLMMTLIFFANPYVTEGGRGADFYVYGRYIEISGGLIIFFSILFLEKMNFNKNFIVHSSSLYIIIMLCGLILALTIILHLQDPRVGYSQIIGMAPFSGKSLFLNPTHNTYIRIFFVSSFLFLIIITLIYFNKKNLMYLLFASLFIYSSAFTFDHFVYKRTKQIFNSISLLSDLRQKIEKTNATIDKIYVLNSDVPKPRIWYTFSNYPVIYLENPRQNYTNFKFYDKNILFLSKDDKKLDYIFDEIYYISKLSGYYVYGFGEKLESSLNQLGYNCQKRELRKAYLYNGNKLPVLLANDEEQNRAKNFHKALILPGGIQYGPYISLKRGIYRVDIYGQNLDAGVYKSHYNLGLTELRMQGLYTSKNHVSYEVLLPEYASRVEFTCQNPSEQPIFIEEMDIVPLAVEGKPLREANTVYLRESFYDVSNEYLNFKSYLTAEKSIISTQHVRVYPQGTVNVNRLSMAPGENILTFSGTDIGLAQIEVFDENGNPVSCEPVNDFMEDFVLKKASKAKADKENSPQIPDSLAVKVFNASQKLTLKIHNNTNEYFDFDALMVRWIEPNNDLNFEAEEFLDAALIQAEYSGQ